MGDDLDQLARLLGDAREFVRSDGFNDAWGALSSADFVKLIEDAVNEISAGHLSPDRAEALWRAFSPTSDWDDGGGEEGLGSAIFEIIDERYSRPS